MKVMIIDDEPFIREGLRRIIDWRKYGCEIGAEAGNALEALSLLKNIKVDLIFLDIKMPGMTGLELAEKIKKEKISSAHIVILTGFADFEYARKAMGCGISDYLLKPVQTEELTVIIEKVKSQKSDRLERIYSEQKEILLDLLDGDGSEKDYASEVLEKQKDIDPLINAVKKNEESRKFEKKDLVREIDDYLDKHYRENISLKQLGEIFHVNNVYLGQLFKSKHDMLFKDYVYYLRIRDAEEMLLNTDKRIYEIAEELGFPNADVFISRFVQLKGVTPNQYRIKNRMKK